MRKEKFRAKMDSFPETFTKTFYGFYKKTLIHGPYFSFRANEPTYFVKSLWVLLSQNLPTFADIQQGFSAAKDIWEHERIED